MLWTRVLLAENEGTPKYYVIKTIMLLITYIITIFCF